MTDMPTLMRALRDGAGLSDNSPTPLYRRLQHGIRRAVREGVVAEDHALPGERRSQCHL